MPCSTESPTRRVAWTAPVVATFRDPVAAPALAALLILFGLNAVDELDRTAFAILLPEIRDEFGNVVEGAGVSAAAGGAAGGVGDGVAAGGGGSGVARVFIEGGANPDAAGAAAATMGISAVGVSSEGTKVCSSGNGWRYSTRSTRKPLVVRKTALNSLPGWYTPHF